MTPHPRSRIHTRKQLRDLPWEELPLKSMLVNLELENVWKKGKTPTTKTRVSIWTLLRTPGRFTTRSPCAFYHKNVCTKAVFCPW